MHILLCIFELHVSLPSVVASLSHHLTAGLVVKAGSGQVSAHLGDPRLGHWLILICLLL